MAQIMEFLLSGFTDNSGEPLALGKVFTYENGTTTPKDTYDVDDSVANNPIILDENGRAQVYGDGNYTLVIKDADDNTLYTFDNVFFGTELEILGFNGSEVLNIGPATALTSAVQFQQLYDGKPHFVTAVSGTGDDIALSPVPSLGTEQAGQYWLFLAPGTNTGQAFANVSGTGAKEIKKVSSGGVKSTLSANDILEDNLYLIGNDGTDYILLNPNLNPTPVSVSTVNYGGTSTGSANAQELTLSPVLSALTTGVVVRYTAGFTNTGAMTLEVDATAATALVLGNGNAMPAGSVVAGQEYEAVYDGTNWVHIELTQARVIARNPDGGFVTNSTTETTVHSTTVKANTLAAGRMLRFSGFGRILNGAGYPIVGSIRIKFGGVTYITLPIVVPATDTVYYDLEVMITSGTASACKIAARYGYTYTVATPPVSISTNANAYTEDFTIDRDFVVTGEITSAPTPAISFQLYSGVLELL